MDTGSPLALDLPPLFWKRLAGAVPTVADLREVDAFCAQVLESMRNPEKHSITRDNFSDIFFGETFTTTLSNGEQVSLIDGGAQTPVTFDNRRRYVDLVRFIFFFGCCCLVVLVVL
jgi:hypothetical protein